MCPMPPIILRRLRQEYLNSGKQGYLARHKGAPSTFGRKQSKRTRPTRPSNLDLGRFFRETPKGTHTYTEHRDPRQPHHSPFPAQAVLGGEISWLSADTCHLFS